MDIPKILMFAALAAFYLAYFGKMRMQRKHGITTNQMGKGDKPARTLRIERLLSFATCAIVPVEIVSIAIAPQCAHNALPLAGIILAALGVSLFIVAMKTMRDNWRAGIPDADDTALVTGGIYRFSRNPAFLGFDLLYIGALIAFFNWVHLAFCLLAVVMMHLQILEEEKYLPSVFGQAYDGYRRRTARYFLFF